MISISDIFNVPQEEVYRQMIYSSIEDFETCLSEPLTLQTIEEFKKFEFTPPTLTDFAIYRDNWRKYLILTHPNLFTKEKTLYYLCIQYVTPCSQWNGYRYYPVVKCPSHRNGEFIPAYFNHVISSEKDLKSCVEYWKYIYEIGGISQLLNRELKCLDIRTIQSI